MLGTAGLKSLWQLAWGFECMLQAAVTAGRRWLRELVSEPEKRITGLITVLVQCRTSKFPVIVQFPAEKEFALVIVLYSISCGEWCVRKMNERVLASRQVMDGWINLG